MPLWILLVSGEAASAQTIIKAQTDRRKLVLYGPAYNSFNPYYKLQFILKTHPDVIALGSSRVMTMRSPFFKKEVGFFNAFGSVYTVNDLRPFLEHLPPGKEPKVLILALDHSFFNPLFNKGLAPADFKEQPIFTNMPNVLRAMFKDYFAKKFTLRDLFSEKRNRGFGLNAIMNGNGSMNDGAYYPGKIIENPEGIATKKRFETTWGDIVLGKGRFPFSGDFSRDNVHELQQFLSRCASRNIYVIGFMPPFTHRAFERIKFLKEEHAFMFKLETVLSKIFREFNFGFFDFSDLAWIGASDEEAIDETHGSEKAFVRLFAIMASEDKRLAVYAQDLQYLEKRVQESTGPFLVFDKDEF